jgi:DNA-binding IclR family transcriptional regulator
MIDFGVWQGRLMPVVRLHHQHQAGLRRLRTSSSSETKLLACLPKDTVIYVNEVFSSQHLSYLAGVLGRLSVYATVHG